MKLISSEYLLTMEGEGAVFQPLHKGALVIDNGVIVDAGLFEELHRQYKTTDIENYPDHVLMPGLINAHTHLDMGHHKNSPFDPVRTSWNEVNPIDWLLSNIDYKKTAKPETLQKAAQEGVESLVESGVTTVADMGSFEGIFKILDDSGLRSVVFPEVIHADRWTTQDLFETALALVEKYKDENRPRTGVGLAPYAPYTLSRNILKILSSYCQSTNTPLMIHSAESFSEMEFFYNSTGDIADKLFPRLGWGENLPPPFHKTPIAYLEEINFLKAKPILVGCVQTTADDRDRISKNDGKVVLCPRANHYLKLGEAKIDLFLKRGIDVALGTDGLPSTNTLSLWDEMRFIYETTLHGKETSVTTRDLLKMATINGAKALGLEDQVGTLKAGKQADYILVKLDEKSKEDDLYARLVKNTKSYHVKRVVVGGKTLK